MRSTYGIRTFKLAVRCVLLNLDRKAQFLQMQNLRKLTFIRQLSWKLMSLVAAFQFLSLENESCGEVSFHLLQLAHQNVIKILSHTALNSIYSHSIYFLNICFLCDYYLEQNYDNMKALHWIRKKSANFFRKKTVAPCPYRACTVRTFKSGCTVRTLSRLPYVVLILSKRAGPATPSSMTLKNFHYVKYCFFSQDEIDEGSI